jgi:hypothetical protein
MKKDLITKILMDLVIIKVKEVLIINIRSKTTITKSPKDY